MKKQYITLLISLSSILCISGCTHMYSVHSQPSLKEQCISLQRQQVFVSVHSADESQWDVRQRKLALANQYQKLGCNQLIHKQPAKKKKRKNRVKIKETFQK